MIIMIKTIKDLLEYYDIDVDAPDYVLNYEFPEEVESYGEYHTEKHDGKTVHVFTNEGEVEGKNIKIEYILDLNVPSWTEIVNSEDSDRPTYHSITFSEDYEMESLG